MTKVVIVPFRTRLRRVAEGTKLQPGEDLSPHTIESLEAGKFIRDEDDTAGAKRRQGARK